MVVGAAVAVEREVVVTFGLGANRATATTEVVVTGPVGSASAGLSCGEMAANPMSPSSVHTATCAAIGQFRNLAHGPRAGAGGGGGGGTRCAPAGGGGDGGGGGLLTYYLGLCAASPQFVGS